MVLYWSEYDPATNTSKNYAWQSHFVPKCTLFDGGSYDMHFPVVLGSTAKTASSKIMTIKSGRISGHASNSGKVSVNGVIVDNSKLVLRSIVAV